MAAAVAAPVSAEATDVLALHGLHLVRGADEVALGLLGPVHLQSMNAATTKVTAAPPTTTT